MAMIAGRFFLPEAWECNYVEEHAKFRTGSVAFRKNELHTRQLRDSCQAELRGDTRNGTNEGVLAVDVCLFARRFFAIADNRRKSSSWHNRSDLIGYCQHRRGEFTVPWKTP